MRIEGTSVVVALQADDRTPFAEEFFGVGFDLSGEAHGKAPAGSAGEGSATKR